MKRINSFFEKIDNYLSNKNFKTKFLKIFKIGFPIFCGLSLIIITTFLIVVKFNPGYGTSGTYVCNYLDSNNNSVVYSKLIVYQDNRCVLYTYSDDGKVLVDPIIKDYRWSIRYQGNSSSHQDKRIPFSNFQFSFENEKYESLFQYFYFPNEKKMITKIYTPFFSDGLVVLKKI